MQLDILTNYNSLHTEEQVAMKEIEEIIGKPIPQYRFAYEDGFGFPMLPLGYTEEKGHVVKIGLSEQNLSHIPESLKKLSKLTTLKINSNTIREIPIWLNDFHYLKSINLGQNQIETIGEQEYWWKHIRALNLESNLLSQIPIGLKNAKELVVATFANNNISEIQEWFGHISSLKVLSLRKNEISNLPNDFHKIRELMQLILAFNHFQTVPETIGMLTHLHVLDLSNNQLNRLPSNLRNLHKLEQLHLENNNFETLPWIIGNLPKLEHLFLSNNPWRGKSKEIVEQIMYEIPKGHWIALEFLRKEYSLWNPENLLEKVRENQEIDELDYFHPDLSRYLPLIEEKCKEINNNTAKSLLGVIAAIQKEQIQSTKILL